MRNATLNVLCFSPAFAFGYAEAGMLPMLLSNLPSLQPRRRLPRLQRWSGHCVRALSHGHKPIGDPGYDRGIVRSEINDTPETVPGESRS